MAVSKLKIAVDTNEWHGGLRAAMRSMDDFVRNAGGLGNALQQDSEYMQRFAQMMGDMESKAGTAKGRISELESALVELRMRHKEMTDEEREGQFGKAMSESIDKLQTKLDDSKNKMKEVQNEMGNVNNSSSESGGALEMLSNKFGIGIDSMSKFVFGGGAVVTALNVAKDAFFANELQLDAWEMAVFSAESVYQGFLDALNTGDISGYLARIDEIVSAANKAYIALDDLGTYNAFNQINVQESTNNLADEMLDYREGTSTKEDVLKAAEAKKKELRVRQKKEQDAYREAVNTLAAKKGVSGDDLYAVLTGENDDYEMLKATPMTGKRNKTVWRGGPFNGRYVDYTEFFPITKKEKLGYALRRITDDEELKPIQALGRQVKQTAYEITQVDRQVQRVLRFSPTKPTRPTKPTKTTRTTRSGGKSGGKGGGKGGGSNTATYTYTSKPEDLEIMDEVTFSGILSRDLDIVQYKLNKLYKTMEELPETASAYYDEVHKLEAMEFDITIDIDNFNVQSAITKLQKEIGEAQIIDPKKLKPLDISPAFSKEGKKAAESWKAASQAISNAGQALNNTGNKELNVAGIIMQAVANVALGFASATAKPATTAAGVFGWIAAATAGVATMVSTIASIKSATKMADGGMIKGVSYAGDAVPILANAGEVVLNRSQQQNIASQLVGQQQGGSLTIRQRGEDLVGVINAFGVRSGRGRLVFSK